MTMMGYHTVFAIPIIEQMCVFSRDVFGRAIRIIPSLLDQVILEPFKEDS